ncbi:hypothetical protein E5C26_20365 [Serratia proteamaculans]|uniref:inositol phosphate phosphatase SopB n=1 Tax=Serratia proteamaculans TaxID=28151 RepID=UPI0010760EE6|nr:inositol phosphate phosphatase SopB [Serratia proteamaculans]TFZ48695.1 hypothetical protein E5C26_20365 [Serratia proteamaculans]
MAPIKNILTTTRSHYGSASSINALQNIAKGEHGLGPVRLFARAIDHSGQRGTSLPDSIEKQSLALMLTQPEHLQASKENLRDLSFTVFENTINMIGKLPYSAKILDPLKDKLLTEFKNLGSKLGDGGIATKLDIKHCKEFSKHLTNTIIHTIRENVGAKAFKNNKIETLIKNELRIGFAAELGKKKSLWEPLQKKIELPSQAGKSNSYESTMLPASRLAALSDNYRQNGLCGVSSMATQETRHAVNLWTTEFKGADVEFQGVRHGVNMPFGEKDPTKQIQGADRRTYEVITAAADVKHEAILEHIATYGTEKPFPLTIVSSSLLTPTKGLKYKKYEIGQQEAWQRATQKSNKGEYKINVPDKNGQLQEVTLKLDVLPFSFGVNGLAKLKSSAPIALKILNKLPKVDVSGWKWADKHNAPLFTQLLNKAKEIKEQGQEGKYARVQSYIAQIQKVIDLGMHHKDEGNAYALPVLVSLLSNELGAVPAWNCMSGKDRTGYLDVKIKETLVLQHQRGNNEIVDQFAKMTDERSQVLEKIIFESGSLEIQKACTGVAGYKVNEGRHKFMGIKKDLSVQSNRNNLLPHAAALLEGLSGAVKA